MILRLLRCLSCTRTPCFSRFPFCSHCIDELVVAETLCTRCGGLDGHPQHTCQPWNLENPNQLSLYLMIGSTHEVLTQWKRHPRNRATELLVRNALQSTHLRSSFQSLRPDVMIPIPQDLDRTLALEGHPSSILAHHLASALNLDAPIEHTLKISSLKTTLQQKERSQFERFESAPRFELRTVSRLKDYAQKACTIWIVDDFKTTGATLRSAEKTVRHALNQPSVQFVWVTLGYRPTLSSTELDFVTASDAARKSVRSPFDPKPFSKTG